MLTFSQTLSRFEHLAKRQNAECGRGGAQRRRESKRQGTCPSLGQISGDFEKRTIWLSLCNEAGSRGNCLKME